MKIAFIDATLPQMKIPKMYQSGRGEGSNVSAAISRAMKDMLHKVKGKRVSIIKCTITITEKAEKEPSMEEPDGEA